MRKIVLATEKILSGRDGVANVSYQKMDSDLIIMFSHSSTNEAGEFRGTTWENMLNLFPAVSALAFDMDDDILIYNGEGDCWESN